MANLLLPIPPCNFFQLRPVRVLNLVRVQNHSPQAGKRSGASLVQQFLPQSLRVSFHTVLLHSLEVIQEIMGVSLPETEATSIALHIINAEYDCDMEKTEGILKIVQNALNIVRYRLCVSFDEASLDYQRFLTHLLFFAQRVMENRMLPDEEDFLYQNIKLQHPKAFDCTLRIRDFIQKEYQIDLPAEELTYLCVHIARVAGERKRPQ